MQAIARQPHRAPDDTPLHDERHRPEQTALYRLVHLLERVVPLVPVRQWVLSLPIPLRLLLASQPYLVTPVLQVARRGALVEEQVRTTSAAGLREDDGLVAAVRSSACVIRCLGLPDEQISATCPPGA